MIYCTLKQEKSLNPYCNGTWSPTVREFVMRFSASVLILIVMEHGLRPTDTAAVEPDAIVLILIVMEHGLRQGRICSLWRDKKVLILIVMEHGLRPYFSQSTVFHTDKMG